MASSSSSRPSGVAAPGLPRSSSTVTRSMSRKSLATLAEDGHAVPSTGARRPTTTLPAPAAGLARSRTSADLASTASLPRARSTASIASRSSLVTSKLPRSNTLTSSRSRRVLVETNLVAGSSSTRTASSASMSAGTAHKPAPTARRYSRTEAGQMTGMGVVRAGPAVQGQRTSPRKSASSSALAATAAGGVTNDPFSTAFVRPTYDFEVSSEREVRPLPKSASMARMGEGRGVARSGLGRVTEETAVSETVPLVGSSAASPFDLTSPQKRVASAAPLISRATSSRQLSIFTDDGDTAMDIDSGARSAALPVATSRHLPIPPSSPFRGALSPRSLTGKTAFTRKLDEMESESDEDDIDFLSPRKKGAKRIHLSAPSPIAGSSSAARPFVPVAEEADEDATIHAPILPRSPPPKKRVPAPPPVLAGSVAPVAKSMPTSHPMQRGGRTFPLPNLAAPSSSSMPPPLVMPRAQAPPPVRREDRSNTMSTRAGGGVRPLRLAGSATAASTLSASGSRLPRPSRVPVAQPAPVEQPLPRRAMSPPPPPPPSAVTDDSMTVDGDTSMCSAADVSTISTASTTSSRSEETARRLANLQSMLSRLQMPKPSAGPSRRTSAEGAPAASTSSSRDYEVPLAPAHEPAVTRRSSLPRSRTSLPSIVGPPPPAPSAASHVAPLLPAGPTARRRSSTAARPAGGIVDTSTAVPLADVSMQSTSSQPVLSTRPSARRSSTATLPSSSSMSALDKAAGKPSNKAALQGVVAFVDVRTAEGDDSGMVFVDLLKSLGARVTTRPSTVTTHIVFKSGRPSTLHFHRSLAPSSRPHLVGIAWVVRCAELSARADEAPFKVEDAAAPIPGTGKENAARDVAAATAQAALGLGGAPAGSKGDAGAPRRRKSMEPKALAALGSAGLGGDPSVSAAGGAGGTARDAALKASIAASIERARRKSLQFMPKVGSPLAKRVFVMPDAPEEDEE
ncbi:hypothetical protein JCM10449v2_006299 [Rhodotorula kratochvilovae]